MTQVCSDEIDRHTLDPCAALSGNRGRSVEGDTLIPLGSLQSWCAGIRTTAPRWLLCGIFITASISKIISPQEFAVAVGRYQVLSPHWNNPVAVYLPWLELCSAVALLTSRRFRGASLVVLSGLLVAFTMVILSAMAKGAAPPCGCSLAFADDWQVGWAVVARNAFLMGLAVASWRYGSAQNSIRGPQR